ncbi:unnamed protein product, partial [Adineta ricciae]
MKLWLTKSKNLQIATKRVEYDLPPKFIGNTQLAFKIDESIVSQEEAPSLYDQMRQVTKDYRLCAMTLYVQTCTREYELLTNEIKQIVEGIPQENDDEGGHAVFLHYNGLRSREQQQQRQYVLDIPNNMIISSQPQPIRSSKTKRNYDRSVKRLKHKFRLANIVLRKTDKSKVLHLGKIDDYDKKSNDYMVKTQAYQCLGTQDPLPDLIQRTNKYLPDLRLAK